MAGKATGGMADILILGKHANVARVGGTSALLFNTAAATDVMSEDIPLHGFLVAAVVDFPNASGDNFAFRISDNDFASATLFEAAAVAETTVAQYNLMTSPIAVAGSYKVTFSCANDLTATEATCTYKLLLIPGG